LNRYVPPFYVALAQTALGHIDAAFAALAQACTDRDPAVTNLAVDPRLAPIRSDARYARLVNDIGLQPAHHRGEFVRG
jgi:hypothetical protein